jgi:hypothetical protein
MSKGTKLLALPPFAQKVISKLQRFEECTSDSQGADIGRHWLDLLTQLGLLNRVQRSPALWEMTQQGEDLLSSPTKQPREVVAGDEVEVLSYLYRHPTGEPWPRTYKARQYDMTDWVETEMVDRAHVTQLQAESASHIKTACMYNDLYSKHATSLKAIRAERDALQSDLTKASERIGAMEGAMEMMADNSDDGDVVEICRNYLARQAAPAAKGSE